MNFCIFFFLLLSTSVWAGEYVVKYRDSKAISALANLSNVKVLHHHPTGRLLKIHLPDAGLKAQVLAMEEVELVVPNFAITLEAPTVPAEGQVVLWSLDKVRAQQAWERAASRGSRDVTVAVIDTGVDYLHPALKDNMVPGYDFVNNRPDGMDADKHGTHCAGIIGAVATPQNPMSGISPVVSIMPLRFLNPRGLGNFYDGIRASDYAVAKKVDIISASWGAQISDPGLAQLLAEMVGRADAAGVLFVTSAGNQNRDNDVVTYFPANSPYRSVIAVGATDQQDKKTAISNYGTNVHVAAPGHDIWSTVPKGKYEKISGTSMAAPLVAGLAALMKSVNPKLTPIEIRDILQETGVKAEMDNACGCRIDALAAIERALER